MTLQIHKKILLVDDEFEICESLEDWLKISGFLNIIKASNGKEALEILNNQNIDIVICDVRMPVLTGIQFIKEAKQYFPQIPIFLMVTGNAELTDKEAKKLGATELLVKPLDLENFIKTIKNKIKISE